MSAKIPPTTDRTITNAMTDGLVMRFRLNNANTHSMVSSLRAHSVNEADIRTFLSCLCMIKTEGFNP